MGCLPVRIWAWLWKAPPCQWGMAAFLCMGWGMGVAVGRFFVFDGACAGAMRGRSPAPAFRVG